MCDCPRLSVYQCLLLVMFFVDPGWIAATSVKANGDPKKNHINLPHPKITQNVNKKDKSFFLAFVVQAHEMSEKKQQKKSTATPLQICRALPTRVEVNLWPELSELNWNSWFCPFSCVNTRSELGQGASMFCMSAIKLSRYTTFKIQKYNWYSAFCSYKVATKVVSSCIVAI